ncbi:MAG: hypothetical protein A3I75_01100 [Deltaproteobacteria bacterium RIFCSPLOWO2_02_FULL_50_16]|nr:MAG: hypothetical protein A3I75_01100 [Deltaproteobacteria bacterium RIFCSPLOWO2_02_FULL_50_16]
MRSVLKKIQIFLIVITIAFEPFVVMAQSELEQVNNLLLNSQNFVGSIPGERVLGGMGARRGTRSGSFRDNSRSGIQGSNSTTAPGSSLGQGIVYQIHVLGEVISPGTYHIGASTRLAEAIQMAGWILERGSERRVEVRRFGSQTKTYDLYRFQYFGNLEDNPYLMDNDVVFVPLNKGLVQIVGAVQRPRQYEITREASLYEIIKLAGGYTKGVLMSEPIKVIRYDNGDKKVLDVDNNDPALKAFKIKAADVYYVPQKLVEGVKFDYTLSNIPGDELFLPAYDDQVYVIGGVSSPGPTPYVPSYTIRQYIATTGGFSRLAKRGKIYILSQAGDTRRINADSQEKINPGDTVIIKEKRMEPLGWLQFTMGLATFSLSIASTLIALR